MIFAASQALMDRIVTSFDAYLEVVVTDPSIRGDQAC